MLDSSAGLQDQTPSLVSSIKNGDLAPRPRFGSSLRSRHDQTESVLHQQGIEPS
jgi:hypothetical protein